jgi:hypothetical protein
MISVYDPVNPSEKSENHYQRRDSLEIRTFVKLKALDQILLGLIKDLNFHEILLRISFMAVSQSTKRA